MRATLRFNELNKITLTSGIKQAFLNVSIPEWVKYNNLNKTETIIRICTRVAFGTKAS